MHYTIGLDGGGTKTRCAAVAPDNTVVFNTAGPGTNFLALGTETACKNILDIIDECRDSLHIKYSDIAGILIGTAGAGRIADADKLQNAFKDFCSERRIVLPLISVRSDAEIALEGAFSGKPGCILIAGTGSIIYGKDNYGNIFRTGGFGRIIGDEGGGYSIGRKVMQAVSRCFDKRGDYTLLLDLLKQKYDIGTPDNLIKEVYENKFDVASAALLAVSAAEKDDKTALKILDEESDELIILVTAHLKKMKTETTKLCLLGSLIESDNHYSRMLKLKITENFPDNVVLYNPDYPPEMGAVFLSQKTSGNL